MQLWEVSQPRIATPRVHLKKLKGTNIQAEQDLDETKMTQKDTNSNHAEKREKEKAAGKRPNSV